MFESLISIIALISFCSSNTLTQANVLREEMEIESNVLPAIRPIQECVTMGAEEGSYAFRSPGGPPSTCGLYLSAEPDKLIKLTFFLLDVDCEQGGLVSVVDGWELNGELLPAPQDHPKAPGHRVHELCGAQRPRRHYLSSQNILMLQYRVPERDQGFIVSVEFLDNLAPCNVLLQGPEASFVSQNFGLRVNCSVTALFPSHVELSSLSVGRPLLPLQTKCSENSMDDFLEVLGSNQLSGDNKAFTDLCGSRNTRGEEEFEEEKKLFANVLCGTSSVRLVSSGKYTNRVSLHFRQLLDEDNAHFMCLPQ